MRAVVASLGKGLRLGVLCASLAAVHAAAAGNAGRFSNPVQSLSAQEGAMAPAVIEAPTAAARHAKRAEFKREHASLEVRQLAEWVVDSGDNRKLPFMIVDKVDAKVFVFDADGRLRGAAPALVGLARGDDSVPGIGEREMSDISPTERTTPAGRFVAALGYDFYGQDVLWVDYDAAIALHRVVTSNPAEHRLQRLATATPADNRISYGCINVPKAFYEHIVSPAFTGTDGIVYVLPETRPPGEVFALPDAGTRAGAQIAKRGAAWSAFAEFPRP